MNIACVIVLVAAGGILIGSMSSSQAQSSPAPVAKPAPIIITNAPAGGRAGKPYLSAGVSEILKMHEAGVDKSVVLAFVQNADVAYHPSAKEVIYLRDQGIPPEIVSAMLKRGGELRDRAVELQREELRTRQFEQPPPPAPAPAEPAQPQSSATAVSQSSTTSDSQTTQIVYASTPAYTYPARNVIHFPSPGYGYVRPSWYGYSYGSWPYYSYSYANCRPYYRSSCYSRYGYGGYYGGYRYAGGWRHCQ